MIHKVIITTFIIISTIACQQQKDGNLLIDLNGTAHNPLYAYSLPDTTIAIDSATITNGVYFFDTKDWEYGFYRIKIDSVNYIDIVANAEQQSICARNNYLTEATTNNSETQLLWNIEQLQHNADTAQYSDSLFLTLKLQADRLRTKAMKSIVLLPLLNMRLGDKNIYNIIADYDIFVAAQTTLEQIAPDNETTKQLSQQITNAKKTADFMSKYSVGNSLPAFSFTTNTGVALSNEQLIGMPTVIYYSTDTTQQALQTWEKIALARFLNNKVVACVPTYMTKPQKINVLTGSFDTETTKQFSPMQPIAIYVDAKGIITDIKLNITH